MPVAEHEIAKDDGSLDIEKANELLSQIANDEVAAGVVVDKPKTKPQADDVPAADDSGKPDDKPVADAKPAKSEATKTDTGDEWFTASDVRELVESLGLAEEDLAAFGGRPALDAHVKLMDRQFKQLGQEAVKKSAAPGEAGEQAARPEKPRGDDGRFVKPDDKPAAAADDDLSDFDEKLVAPIRSLQATVRRLEERLAESSRREAEVHQRRIVEQFDGIVDQLGHDDLFGKSGEVKPGSEQFKARERLWDDARVLIAGMEATGKKVDGLTKAIIVRALGSSPELAEKVQLKTKQAFDSKVRQQAGRVSLGGRKSSAMNPVDPERDLIARYHQMESEGR